MREQIPLGDQIGEAIRLYRRNQRQYPTPLEKQRLAIQAAIIETLKAKYHEDMRQETAKD